MARELLSAALVAAAVLATAGAGMYDALTVMRCDACSSTTGGSPVCAGDWQPVGLLPIGPTGCGKGVPSELAPVLPPTLNPDGVGVNCNSETITVQAFNTSATCDGNASQTMTFAAHTPIRTVADPSKCLALYCDTPAPTPAPTPYPPQPPPPCGETVCPHCCWWCGGGQSTCSCSGMCFECGNCFCECTCGSPNCPGSDFWTNLALNATGRLADPAAVARLAADAAKLKDPSQVTRHIERVLGKRPWQDEAWA